MSINTILKVLQIIYHLLNFNKFEINMENFVNSFKFIHF